MTRLWQRFADFLHTANLIPLVVVVSTYHYYQALRSHDPLLVSLPIALFIDLLHYRTVSRAVQSNEITWKVTAVFTTLLAFGLQWMFYSQPGENGMLDWWQALLFASIVPIGLAIMAWHHQQQEQETITDWQTLITEAQERAETVQQEAAVEHERVEAMQREAEAEQQRANEMQARAEEMQARAVEVQNRLDRVQAEATQMQIKLNEMQTLALFNAQLLTVKDAAAQLGVHVTTVRRKAKLLNGVDGGS